MTTATHSAIFPVYEVLETQAQLFIHIYPSQDNANSQTLWVFSGFSQTTTSWSIRTSGTYSARNSWEVGGNLFNANKPDNQTISLSPLLPVPTPKTSLR